MVVVAAAPELNPVAPRSTGRPPPWACQGNGTRWVRVNRCRLLTWVTVGTPASRLGLYVQLQALQVGQVRRVAGRARRRQEQVVLLGHVQGGGCGGGAGRR